MSWLACGVAFAAVLAVGVLPTRQALAATDNPSLTRKVPFEVYGWLPYWRAATSTADALPRLSSFTGVNPFAYSVKKDGSLYDLLHLTEEPWASFSATAQAGQVRVIPTVMWSDAQAMHTVLKSKTARTAHVRSIVAMVQEGNYEGVDIDYEQKWAETKPYFSQFLKELHFALGNKFLLCTIEPRTPLSARYEGTPPSDATKYANDYVAINRYCDRVIIMAYDQGSIDVKLNAATNGPYVPNADVRWVEKVLTLALKEISPKKLIVGIPTYGYEYDVTPLSEQGYRYDRLWAFNPKYALDIATVLNVSPMRTASGELSLTYASTTAGLKPTAVVERQAQAGLVPLGGALTSASANALVREETFRVMWWSDASAIQDKVLLAKKLGVRGVAIFKIDGGQDPGLWDVLAAHAPQPPLK